MKPDVAVIGAGPAGLQAATTISKYGYQVEIFEEHGKVGYPVHCAGIVSVEGLNRLGIKPDPIFHQNTIFGGKIFSSDGNCLTIRDKKPRAYIIDRGKFDTFLSWKAEDHGVTINTGRKVSQVIFKEDNAKFLKLSNTRIEVRKIIDAEGPLGRVLSRSGIPIVQRGVLNGFNVELKVDEIENDLVEVWLSQKTAKNFFTWVIPISENRVRCGLATSRKNGIEALKSFIKKRFGTEPRSRISSGIVCTGGPIKKTAYPGLLLVGDVAGQVKPTTGGGVIIGGLCANIAGKTTAMALGEDSSKFTEYEKQWRMIYGSELKTMLFLRRILNRISDTRINKTLNTFKNESFEEKFNSLIKEGDMDLQASIIKRAIRDPAILSVLARTLRRIVVSDLVSIS
jgi:geranylgeranyl reductase family protein